MGPGGYVVGVRVGFGFGQRRGDGTGDAPQARGDDSRDARPSRAQRWSSRSGCRDFRFRPKGPELARRVREVAERLGRPGRVSRFSNHAASSRHARTSPARGPAAGDGNGPFERPRRRQSQACRPRGGVAPARRVRLVEPQPAGGRRWRRRVGRLGRNGGRGRRERRLVAHGGRERLQLRWGERRCGRRVGARQRGHEQRRHRWHRRVEQRGKRRSRQRRLEQRWRAAVAAAPAAPATRAAGGASAGRGGTGAGGTAGTASGGSGGSGATACTRELLKSTITAYFTALAAHSASTLPTATNVKFTENGRVMTLGQGLWMTAGAVKHAQSALDVEICSSATHAVVPEGSMDIPVALRLKLVESEDHRDRNHRRAARRLQAERHDLRLEHRRDHLGEQHGHVGGRPVRPAQHARGAHRLDRQVLQDVSQRRLQHRQQLPAPRERLRHVQLHDRRDAARRDSRPARRR